MSTKSIIYYGKEKMQSFLPIFEKIKTCKSCMMNGKHFAIDSNILIKEPQNDLEVEFNSYQRKAFADQWNRCIYSWVI